MHDSGTVARNENIYFLILSESLATIDHISGLPAPNFLKKGTRGPFLIKKGTLTDQLSIKIRTNL